MTKMSLRFEGFLLSRHLSFVASKLSARPFGETHYEVKYSALYFMEVAPKIVLNY